MSFHFIHIIKSNLLKTYIIDIKQLISFLLQRTKLAINAIYDLDQ